jgi:dihydroflavonol-4-reductase
MALFSLKFMMKVAVTGASGHIGNCLVRELKNQGIQVKVLVHSFRNDLDEMDVELIQGNLLDTDSLNKLCAGVEVVFHLAAQIAIDNRFADQLFETNVTGTKNILQAAQINGVKKFIHFSSIDAFQIESSDQFVDENTPLLGQSDSIYGYTKAESERVVLKAANEGLKVAILSPTAVIGPNDCRGSILGQALIKIFKNKLPFLVNGGFNWVDVRDVVYASIQAMNSDNACEKYILGGNFCTLKELTSKISRISGSKIPAFVPVWLARLAAPFLQIYSIVSKKDPIFTNHSLDLLVSSPENISFKKAERELGYKPRSLEETLQDTYNWYEKNNFLS